MVNDEGVRVRVALLVLRAASRKVRSCNTSYAFASGTKTSLMCNSATSRRLRPWPLAFDEDLRAPPLAPRVGPSRLRTARRSVRHAHGDQLGVRVRLRRTQSPVHWPPGSRTLSADAAT